MVDVQFAELTFDGLRESLLLFVHDQTSPNILQLLTSTSQLYDGALVEVVLSGKMQILLLRYSLKTCTLKTT